VRRLAVVAVLAAASGAAARARRRFASAERVSLRYDDGSMLTLDSGSPQADRLLAVARDALGATR
jgi:hypothetical protein